MKKYKILFFNHYFRYRIIGLFNIQKKIKIVYN